jgi:hypothetical protein
MNQFINESREIFIRAFNSTTWKEKLKFSSITHHGFQNSFEKFHVDSEVNNCHSWSSIDKLFFGNT